MKSSQASAAALLAAIAIALSTSHGFTARVVTNSKFARPLHATESFQRSLLEAQFTNSIPDSAPTIDVMTAVTNTMAEHSLDTHISILRIAASTDRGQNANMSQKERVYQLVSSLEESNILTKQHLVEEEGSTTTIPSYLAGTWELLYSNTQLFRSSPFFLAGRSTCETPEQAAQYDWFCDMHRMALAISTIGNIRQVITRDGRLVNEFEVKVGAVPFLSDILPGLRYSGGWPVTIDGAIVSTADVTPRSWMEWELCMDTVEIKGSNIPILRNLLDSDNVVLKSRDLSKVLEDNVDAYQVPKPVVRTTYVGEGMRIVKDMDDNVFIYGRVSDSEIPTDYSGNLPDLGAALLLERFNDAVTKIFL